jgi:hypothetical protein
MLPTTLPTTVAVGGDLLLPLFDSAGIEGATSPTPAPPAPATCVGLATLVKRGASVVSLLVLKLVNKDVESVVGAVPARITELLVNVDDPLKKAEVALLG